MQLLRTESKNFRKCKEDDETLYHIWSNGSWSQTSTTTILLKGNLAPVNGIKLNMANDFGYLSLNNGDNNNTVWSV